MTFLIAWIVLLLLFLTVAVYRGYKNKARIRKISARMKSMEIKVNDIWQRIK